MTSNSEKNPAQMDSYQVLDLLRQSPSRELWTIVLRRLLQGDFRMDVERLGYEGFLRANASEAEPAWSAEIELYAALEQLVRSWQPEELRPADYLEAILQLINSFTPPSGFSKILGQLDRYGGFNIGGETPALKKEIMQLALEALGNYYSTPPASATSDTGYGFYIAFLRHKLDSPEMAVHACRRLVELGEIDPSSHEVEKAIDSDPRQMIQEFLQTFLIGQHTVASAALSNLYGFCLEFDHVLPFNEVLRDLGYDLQHWNTPVLVAPTGEKHVLSPEVIKRYMNKYMAARFQHARFSAAAKLERLGKTG